MAAGTTMNELTRNLSDRRHPCVEVATMVVSLMKDRLSPKSDPPTMTAVINGMLVPVCSATPAAIGVSATMVPTLVPTPSEMKQAATKRPASNMFPGNSVRARLTVASMAPIVLAELAKAPARTNIQSISIICSVPAPRLKVPMRLLSGKPPVTMTA